MQIRELERTSIFLIKQAYRLTKKYEEKQFGYKGTS